MSEERFRAGELEERFRAGDETALIEMYRRYSAPMFATALKLAGNREYAAEAVQLAFVQAWRSADRFDAERDLLPWLYAITRRAVIDVHRREHRLAGRLSPLSLTDLGEAESTAASDPTAVEDSWQAWQVREALERLSPDERQVLQLAYFEQLTQREIAATLDIAIGTVKSRTARAQRRLAELLAHLQEAHLTAA